MNTLSGNDLKTSCLNELSKHAQKGADLHIQFIDLRMNGLRVLSELFIQQSKTYRQDPDVLFSSEDLREFAEGDIVKCLGQNYAVYKGRRSPRIPNGDLLLISRVLRIHGQPNEFTHQSEITAEYDVPEDAWYLSGDGKRSQLPISICMEIALQPCGFLSAYLYTPLRFPNEDYFFRNLGGSVSFTRTAELRGKTIETQALLIETIFSGTTIIQHFSFELLCNGLVFFKGTSSFGYFPAHTMANQVGLDGGETRQPWFHSNLSCPKPLDLTNDIEALPAGRLRLIDDVVIDPSGGIHNAGYIYGSRINSAADWFYACHFYQDPVMPGSLGIEAIVQAMRVFASLEEKPFKTVYFPAGQEMTWKYRGQVLQTNKRMQLEVHFRKNWLESGVRYLSGDASLWADDRRIYEIHNMSLAIPESQPRDAVFEGV